MTSRYPGNGVLFYPEFIFHLVENFNYFSNYAIEGDILFTKKEKVIPLIKNRNQKKIEY